MRNIIKRRYLPLVAYLILLVAVVFANVQVVKSANATDDKQLVEQRAGCKRTNDLRRSINDQNQLVRDNNRITYTLFKQVAAGVPKKSEFSKQINDAISKQVEIDSKYTPLSIIDCEKAYKDNVK